MISGFLDGLDILKKYDTEPPIVTSAYIITIPKIKQADITGPGDQAAMDAAGWLVHPVYESYYYPVETITELGNVTGLGNQEMPPFPIPILPPIIPPTP